jgi:trimethylamine---corrinoid protein Co-methyltransferase
MNQTASSQVRPAYRLLTQEQIEEIHRGTLEVLETVGIRIPHEAARQLLIQNGCRQKTDDIILFPNWLVEQSLQSAPSRITIYNRRGQEAMRLEGRNNYFGTGTDLLRTIDLETGQARTSRLQDVINAARVADACSDVDFIASFALPRDVPTNLMYLRCVKAMLENSTKPVFFTAAGKEDLEFILQMAAAVAGGEQALQEKPFLIHYAEPTAPLSHSFGAINKLFLCAERGIPICYTAGDILGGSAPVTLAGGIIQANAENLSGIVLHQLKHKGAPIISGFAVVPMDMKTTTFSYGAPDWRLTNSAFADLYHYYGIPMWSTVGSDAHCLDEQAGMEHAFGTLLAAMDGANLIHDIGYLGQGLLGSPAAIVMSDEIVSYVKRIMRGFEMDREHMAIDLMRKVGPGGNYLAEKHTVKHFRTELWQPKLINRDNPETWEENGSLRYGEKIRRKALAILADFQLVSLPPEIQAKIDEIAAQAETKLGKFEFIA